MTNKSGQPGPNTLEGAPVVAGAEVSEARSVYAVVATTNSVQELVLSEIELPISDVVGWFADETRLPYVRVSVKKEHSRRWPELLKQAIRKCYLSDELLRAAIANGKVEAEVIASRLPDPGAVMAGDFGEIVGFLYQAAKVQPNRAYGPKKWRLKQDRKKPAPHSDVVQFVLPEWPRGGASDEIHCAEVKVKSTDGDSDPIETSIAGSAKDRASRLSATLEWLSDRSQTEDLGEVTPAMINRFRKPTEYPAARKHFRAMVVICASLIEREIASAKTLTPAHCELVIVVVPDLYQVYSDAFRLAGSGGGRE